MIIFFLILILFIFSIYGYSYLFRIILNNSFNKNLYNKSFNNQDLIYGIFFIILILLFLHFLFPIKYLIFLIPLGIVVFIYSIIKSHYKIKDLKLNFFFLFLVLFVVSSNGPTYDTQLYHHQILNWNYNYKISLNLALLDDRMGMISPWQLFLSLGNFKIFGSYAANLFNFIPISLIFINFFEVLKKVKKISSIFLILSVLYIFLFSLIHPFQNGTILMNLGSLGSDLAGMCFYILAFFYFFKTFEENKIEYYNLNLICVLLAIFCRISYFPLIFLPMFLIINKKNLIFNKFNILIFFTFIFWLLRSILNNGCLIFPVKNTCLNIKGYLAVDQIEIYSNTVKSFARTAPEYENFMNLEYSINTLNWLIPWFQDYFLKTSITQIFFGLFLVFLIPFVLKLLNIKKNLFIIIFGCITVFTFSFILWLQAPDVRFSLGLFITLPVFLICFSLNNNLFIKIINSSDKMLFLIFVLLVLKNYSNYQYLIDKNYLQRNYNYSNFKTYKNTSNYKIVKNESQGGFCYDISDVCKTGNNFNFYIKKTIFDYIIFKSNN